MKYKPQIFIILLLFAGYFVYKNQPQSNLQTYKNTDYNFTISYPKNLTPEFVFKTYYHLSNTWRNDVMPESKGKGIISIPIYRIENKDSYPRYFDAELRIGASSDAQDVADCYNPNSGYQLSTTTEIINGIEFRKFEFGGAGMMQYLYGVSYRTIHNNICYAIEKIKTGSNYSDGPMPNDISQSVLDGYYDQIFDIIKTFKFIK